MVKNDVEYYSKALQQKIPASEYLDLVFIGATVVAFLLIGSQMIGFFRWFCFLFAALHLIYALGLVEKLGESKEEEDHLGEDCVKDWDKAEQDKERRK